MGLFDRNTDNKKNKGAASSAVRGSSAVGVPETLPVIALKNTVIYPHTVVPVFFEDENSLKALERAQSQEGAIAAFTLTEESRLALSMGGDESASDVKGVSKTKDDSRSSVEPQDLYGVGTMCRIHRVMPVTGRHGAMVVLQGVAKVRAIDFWRDDSFLTVAPMLEEDVVENSKSVQALMRNALLTAQKIIANTPYMPQELQIALEDLTDPLKFVYLLATLVRFDVSEKQIILEERSVEEKLKKTAAILSRELEQIELGGKIVSNVKKEFGKMNREAFLRQQLREIQKELGEESEGQRDAREYMDRLNKGEYPDYVRKELEREISRVSTMHPQSSEYHVLRTYIDLVLDLPWGKPKEKELDISSVVETLDKDHFGLKDVKLRIAEYMAARKLNKEHKGPILCFVGPPGVGKTSLGKSIANALGREFVRISLGGMHDESEIRGHRRTYVGAMPGKIIQGIRRAGTRNPVFMLDEIDKIGSDFKGDPASALLEVLDPEQNNTFHDHYLDLDFDLSDVMFIATANVMDTIQPALRDRMEVIEISGYVNEEKIEIAKSFLWPKVLKAHGLTKSKVKVSDDTLRLILEEYTRESGVRGFERELSKIARKAAYDFVTGKSKTLTINKKRVREYLGPRKVYSEVAARTAKPGVATGLAYTQAGGEILFVEAVSVPGGRRLMLTGSLGDVMKESAKASLSVVKARAKALGIDESFFKKNDIHVHVPAGAVPKDGPSAGVTIATAIVSLALGLPVRNDVAMTGEITLTGDVLPIGGVKEKVLSAKRAGIKTVLLPEKNKPDVEEIDKELLDGLEFLYVKDVDDVLTASIRRDR